jgi:hypothetical protein
MLTNNSAFLTLSIHFTYILEKLSVRNGGQV